jgi:hypothetical protein
LEANCNKGFSATAAKARGTLCREPAKGPKSMNSYDDLYGSRFLAATDLKAPVNAVIERIEQENFRSRRRTSSAESGSLLQKQNKRRGLQQNECAHTGQRIW